MTDKDEKELFKQAIKEWMDEQYAKLGKWVLSRLFIAAFVTAVGWYITTHGGKFP